MAQHYLQPQSVMAYLAVEMALAVDLMPVDLTTAPPPTLCL